MAEEHTASMYAPQIWSVEAESEGRRAPEQPRACRDIKHTCTYACKAVRQELDKLQADPASIAVAVPCTPSSNSSAAPAATVGAAATEREPSKAEKGGTIQVAEERFLAPEIFFDPSVAGIAAAPLQQLVDEAIQACSIDSRRKLYANICLSVRDLALVHVPLVMLHQLCSTPLAKNISQLCWEA